MSEKLNTKNKVRATNERKQKSMGATRLPQVNLLPSDISDARSLKRLKGVLAAVLALVLVVIGGATFVASTSVSDAQERVDAENRETTRLQTEQRKYAEVPVILQRYSDTSNALFRASVGEIMWVPVIDAVTATLPKDVEVRKLVVESWTPTEGAPSGTDPAQIGGMARLAFELASETRPQVAALLAGLEDLPGFADARVSSLEAVGAGDAVTYSSIVSVSLNLGAVSGRFIPKELS